MTDKHIQPILQFPNCKFSNSKFFRKNNKKFVRPSFSVNQIFIKYVTLGVSISAGIAKV